MTTTRHTTQHVTIPMQVDRQELLENLMGASWETWDWWHDVTYADGCDWDKHPESDSAPYVTVGLADPFADEGATCTKTLSVGDILSVTTWVLGNRPHLCWDDWDADSADLVMQVAVLGVVAYS